MHIGIIIYSQSGNTREVAAKLKEKLISGGHRADLIEITINGKTPAQTGQFELTTKPDPGDYDAVIFGSPVQAFNLNPVMRSYLEQLPGLKGKKAACFITKHLPVKWSGGTQAVNKIQKACESKGADFRGAEIIIWSAGQKQDNIDQAVKKLAALF